MSIYFLMIKVGFTRVLPMKITEHIVSSSNQDYLRFNLWLFCKIFCKSLAWVVKKYVNFIASLTISSWRTMPAFYTWKSKDVLFSGTPLSLVVSVSSTMYMYVNEKQVFNTNWHILAAFYIIFRFLWKRKFHKVLL